MSSSPDGAPGQSSAPATKAVRIYKIFDKIVGRVEITLELFAQVALLGLMLLTAANAAMRYIFGAPIVMSLDITAIYIVPALVWLAVPKLHADQGHIRATFLINTFIGMRRKIVELMSELIVLGATILMLSGAWDEMWANSGVYITGQLSLAVMPSWIFAVLGLAGLTVRVLIVIYSLLFVSSFPGSAGTDSERVTDIA